MRKERRLTEVSDGSAGIIGGHRGNTNQDHVAWAVITAGFTVLAEAPSRWYQLTPGLLDGADERQLMSDAEAQHVEYVIVTNRSTLEYRYPYFGVDWDEDIYRWINNDFEVIGQFGEFQRIAGAPFSAVVYPRRTWAGATEDKRRTLNQ